MIWNVAAERDVQAGWKSELNMDNHPTLSISNVRKVITLEKDFPIHLGYGQKRTAIAILSGL